MTGADLKQFCKEQNLTYKEFAELVGYTEAGIKTIVSRNEISESLEKSIELLKRVYELEAKLNDMQNLKNTLKNLLELK
ncbi:transcriptional regulator [Campylobacter sp. faydin G-24]|uniref:Transcriptional regulator n=1 Tax=Campylobacter anatolicus TaxID=2829105 RepID=A0ABS5HKD4_9BACT|nr:transcriptional regulator [Campylobacter anatolicus]MBR8464435.1 transcriptional regulator [Campylobacter anatolicus]MBR8466222.1 transcriptional regulator [Campylobacter anatolicus]